MIHRQAAPANVVQRNLPPGGVKTQCPAISGRHADGIPRMVNAFIIRRHVSCHTHNKPSGKWPGLRPTGKFSLQVYRFPNKRKEVVVWENCPSEIVEPNRGLLFSTHFRYRLGELGYLHHGHIPDIYSSPYCRTGAKITHRTDVRDGPFILPGRNYWLLDPHNQFQPWPVFNANYLPRDIERGINQPDSDTTHKQTKKANTEQIKGPSAHTLLSAQVFLASLLIAGGLCLFYYAVDKAGSLKIGTGILYVCVGIGAGLVGVIMLANVILD